MRILLLSWNFPPTLGGIEYVVGNLFAGLCKKNEVRLITGLHNGANPEEHVIRCPRKGLKAYVPFSFTKGFNLCRSFKPDMILCGSVVPAPAAWMLSILFRVPYVVLMHGSDILYPGRIYQAVVKFVLRHATRLSANSGQTRQLLIQAGMKPEKIDVVHPGVRIEDFEQGPEMGAETILKEAEGRRVLMTVGRLIRRKGVQEFVENVMPALVAAHPDVLYLVVGDDAKASLVHKERLRDRIQASIERLNLQKHVKLLGSLEQKDLLSLYFRADIFVLPCLDIPGDIEGFGIVFSEAALAGAPSLATQVGGIPEAVIDGETGLLVEPGNFEALTAAALRLLEDESLRSRLAQNGAQRARTHFSWQVITNAYEDVCQRTKS